MASTLSDSQLVARCRAGDQQAWAELVERFSRYVYAIAVQAFRLSDADAEDVFQEVFARAYQHLDKLRDDAAVRPRLPPPTSTSPPRTPPPGRGSRTPPAGFASPGPARGAVNVPSRRRISPRATARR